MSADRRARMPRKVLLITADQWRGDALGLLGHKAASTPVLDRLAADGTTFLRHYTPSAPCGPARATLLTGLYPFVHRSVRNGTPLDRRFTNLALEARRAGREPMLFGYTDSSVDPRGLPPDDPRLRTYEGVLPGFTVGAVHNSASLGDWLADLAGKGYAIPERPADIYAPSQPPARPGAFSRTPARYCAEDSDSAWITGRLLDHLRTRRDEDWFVHLVFLRPHPPLVAPAPYDQLVDAASVPEPVRGASRAAEAAAHPFLDAWMREQANPAYFESRVDVQAIDDDDRRAMAAVYFGLIAEVDAQIGRIIDHLKATGEYDETLIIFTSDHGEMLGDHWCWGKGGYFDPAYHVPLIIRDPAAPAAARGRRVDAFTESVDLMPTILGWIGAEVPGECNGLDLSAWIAGDTPALWRQAAFFEYDFRNPVTRRYEQALGLSGDECTLNVLRGRRYRYVHFTSLKPLLYDLAADPGETVNLADDPAHAAVVAAFAQRLMSLRLLHAERSLANAMLSPQGVVRSEAARGFPPGLFGPPGA